MLPPPCSYHVRNIARGLKITARVKTPSKTNLFSAFVRLLMCCVLLCNNADNIKVKSLQLSVYGENLLRGNVYCSCIFVSNVILTFLYSFIHL